VKMGVSAKHAVPTSAAYFQEAGANRQLARYHEGRKTGAEFEAHTYTGEQNFSATAGL